MNDSPSKQNPPQPSPPQIKINSTIESKIAALYKDQKEENEGDDGQSDPVEIHEDHKIEDAKNVEQKAEMISPPEFESPEHPQQIVPEGGEAKFEPPEVKEERASPNEGVMQDEEDLNLAHDILGAAAPEDSDGEFVEAKGPNGQENVEEEPRPDIKSQEEMRKNEDAKEIEDFAQKSLEQPQSSSETNMASYKKTQSSIFGKLLTLKIVKQPGKAVESDKFKKIYEINKQSMAIYEQDRKRAKEESQKQFSDKGYIAGPSEQAPSDDILESISEDKRISMESKKEEKKVIFEQEKPKKEEDDSPDLEFDFGN